MAWYDDNDDAFGPEDLGVPNVARYDRYLQTLSELDIEQMPFDDDTADQYMY